MSGSGKYLGDGYAHAGGKASVVHVRGTLLTRHEIPLDPITAALRKADEERGEDEDFHSNERSHTPLPLLKNDVRGMGIMLRSDGHAAMIPRLLDLKTRHNDMLPHMTGHMRARADAAMHEIKRRMHVSHEMQRVIGEAVGMSRMLPAVGSRVVVKLKVPFCGYRADGMVKYVGPCEEEGSGIWIGIELREPIGQHDGHGYFACRQAVGRSGPYYGVFVRGNQIEFSDKVTDSMRKSLGVRKLASNSKDLASRKFWKDPFVPSKPPAFLRAHSPFHFSTDYVIGSGASVTKDAPFMLNEHERGWKTAR